VLHIAGKDIPLLLTELAGRSEAPYDHPATRGGVARVDLRRFVLRHEEPRLSRRFVLRHEEPRLSRRFVCESPNRRRRAAICRAKDPQMTSA
jgi:hypothetical protein